MTGEVSPFLPLGGLFSIVRGVVGCLGAIVFGLAAWIGVVVVLGMALMQLGRSSVGMARIAKWQSEIAAQQTGRRERERPSRL